MNAVGRLARLAGFWLFAAWLGWAQAQNHVASPAGNPGRAVTVGADRLQTSAAMPQWVQPALEAAASESRGPAVFLWADTQLRVDPQPARFVHAAVQMNTPSTVEQFGRFAIQFNPAYHRVVLHRLRVLRGGEWVDRLEAARITFLQREAFLEQGVYTGDVTASLLVSDLRVGDVLEYAYTREGQNPVFAGKFVDEVSWDLAYHTEQRRVSLLAPEGRGIQWRMVGGERRGVVQPTESVASGQRRWVWQARNLPRVDVEERVPVSASPFRTLAVSEFADWPAVASWADDLFRDAHSPADATLAQVLDTLRAKPTPEEQVAAALAWVQKEVRYVSLALGEGSHRPAAPAQTVERRWGDCKDKSALLIQLLRGLGLPARPVLVSANNPQGVREQLPSPRAFDHVIVQVDLAETSHFLDPTRQGQGKSLASLGQRWEDAQVLVVRPGTSGQLLTIGLAQERVRRDELREVLSLPQFGGAGELTVRRTWRGIAAENVRAQAADASDEAIVRFLLRPYERRYPGHEVIEKVRLEDDAHNNEITAVFKLRISRPWREERDLWRVLYEASNIAQLLPEPESSQRQLPYALYPRARLRYAMEVEFPDIVAVRNDPRVQELRDPAFHLTAVHAFRGNRATVTLDLEIRQIEVTAERIAAYAQAVRRLRNQEYGSVWAYKAQLDRATVPPAERDNMATRVLKQMSQREATVDRSLRSGLLQGDDLGNALCEKARLLSWRGDPAALDEARKAVQHAPNHVGVLICQGVVQSSLGAFTEAVASFDAAIVLQPADGVVYQARGRARFYAGQLERAAEDFKRAGHERVIGDNRHYALLWRTLAMLRMGKQADEETARLASEHARGEWPLPAVAMLQGVLTPEDLLAPLERKTGVDRELTLAEAYFYVGQWWLAQGDRAKAADYFRRVRGFGILSFVEHQGAGHELKQIEAAAR